MPVMEPDLSSELLRSWAETIDAGPWSSLAWGERMAFDNPETLTFLGAMAAWTRRVRLVTTIVVPQLHDPVMLAKALATGDMLSGGRLSVGVGVGGREEDYVAAGADPATQKRAEMARRVAVMRRVWSGENVTDARRPVGPPPVQAGGPPVLVGTLGPRTITDAAQWADGLAGVTLDLGTDGVSRLFRRAEDAWAAAGRPRPRLTTSFWFALADDDSDEAQARARDQVRTHLLRYMNWLPADLVEAMAPTTGFAGTAAELREVLQGFADIGADEVLLIPTSDDLTQVQRAAEVVAGP